MGKFIYEGVTTADFDDRVLAHVQVVVGQKLRRGEAFHFTWREDPSVGDGRTSVWLHPGASLVYKYFGSRPPRLNRTWLEALTHTANSTAGLHIVGEPPESTGGEPTVD